MVLHLPAAVGIGVLCILFIRLLIPVSGAAGLMDIASGRKRHQGQVPLVGGLAIVASVSIGTVATLSLPDGAWWIGLALGVVTIMGVLDDRRPAGAPIRLAAQLGTGLVIAMVADVQLRFVGDLIGNGTVVLGVASVPLTAIAIAGASNAFNMVDGIDGLAGSTALVAIGGLLVLVSGRAEGYQEALLLYLASALAVFLIFNLSAGPHKVFLGDAGSTFIGVCVAVAVIATSQRGLIRPPTALWLIGVPLMDLALTVARRARNRRPLLRGDRRHLHHVLLRRGLADRAVLRVVVALSLTMAAVGILFEAAAVADHVSVIAFLAVFTVYVTVVERLRSAAALRSPMHGRWPVDHGSVVPVDVVESPLHGSEVHLGEQSV